MSEIPPVLLSDLTFQRRSETLFAEQCDCACADTDLIPLDRVRLSEGSLRCADVHSQPLPSGHMLVFNPRSGAGLAVLNSSARQVWEWYRMPGSGQLGSAAYHKDPNSTALLQQMVSHGLLEAREASSIQLRRGSPHTLGAWLHITDACNLQCDYCYLGRSCDSMSEIVGRAVIDALIRSALRGGFKRVKVKFAGGEPSLNLGLVYALQAYAYEAVASAGLDFDSIILSNGVSLSKEAIAGLKSRDIRVMISLDGIGEGHDTQRKHSDGTGSFVEVSRTLDRLASQGLKPFISITITGRNVCGLPVLVNELLDRDLSFNFNLFRDNAHVKAGDLDLTDDQAIEALEQALAVIESRLPPYSLLGSLLDRCALDRPHERTCGVGESYLVFDHRGNVAKCHMEIENPVADAWSDDPLADVIQDQQGLQNPGVNMKDGCRDCEWKYWCAGGCPLVTFRATGRYNVRSPYCRIYKATIPRMLRLEGLRLMKLAGLRV